MNAENIVENLRLTGKEALVNDDKVYFKGQECSRLDLDKEVSQRGLSIEGPYIGKDGQSVIKVANGNNLNPVISWPLAGSFS